MLLHARPSNREANGRGDPLASRAIYASIISRCAGRRAAISAGRIHLIKERINMNAGRVRLDENKRYIAR